MAVGLVIFSKAIAFKAKAKNSRPRPQNPKAKKCNLALGPRINIPVFR